MCTYANVSCIQFMQYGLKTKSVQLLIQSVTYFLQLDLLVEISSLFVCHYNGKGVSVRFVSVDFPTCITIYSKWNIIPIYRYRTLFAVMMKLQVKKIIFT